jgi:hypothetical protein
MFAAENDSSRTRPLTTSHRAGVLAWPYDVARSVIATGLVLGASALVSRHVEPQRAEPAMAPIGIT